MALYDVRVPQKEGTFFAQIAVTMLSAYGGDFDEDDTVYTDIDLVDGQRLDESHGYGGVSGWHFGRRGDPLNQGVSSYVGPINEVIRFRIVVRGDDHVGATVSVVEI